MVLDDPWPGLQSLFGGPRRAGLNQVGRRDGRRASMMSPGLVHSLVEKQVSFGLGDAKDSLKAALDSRYAEPKALC